MNKNNKDDVLILLFYLLIRQTGSLADCFRHIQKDRLFETEQLQGWRAYVQTELGDVTVLVEKTCALFDLDYQETQEIGRRRDAEKAEEYLKRHPGGLWV